MRTFTARAQSRSPSTPRRRLTVSEIQGRDNARLLRGAAAVTALTLATAILSLILGSLGGIPLGILVVVAALLIPASVTWLWHKPVRGIYALFAGAVFIASASDSTHPDYLTQYLPLFQDFNTITNSKFIAFSPFELVVAIVLITWLLKSIANRNLRFDRGSLLLPLLLYMLLVLLQLTRGVSSGSALNITLWEMRAQAYMLIAYILTCNLIKHRPQINVLCWIVIIGAGLQGIEGTLRYLLTIRGATTTGINELYSHEQAFFFNAFLTLTAVLFLYEGPQRMKRVTLWLLPFVVIASLANNRRAAIVALAIALIVMLFVIIVTDAKRRRKAAIILAVLAVGFPPYYVAFQNRSGTLGMPARAIASNFNPSARDASSNSYRVNEDKDIMLMVRASPFTGTPFGEPMREVYPLPYITKIYANEDYLPHNSILWVWMRLGSLGYFFFWILIGLAIVQSTRLTRRTSSSWVQGLGLFILLMVVQQVVFGYLDMQWTIYRNMVAMGVLFALISRLDRMSVREKRMPPLPKDPLKSSYLRRSRLTHVPVTVSVVDGTLKR